MVVDLLILAVVFVLGLALWFGLVVPVFKRLHDWADRQEGSD